MSRLTRRELAVGLSTSAVLLARPQARPQAAAPAEDLKDALAQVRESADQLDSFPLPMTAEPASVFKP